MAIIWSRILEQFMYLFVISTFMYLLSIDFAVIASIVIPISHVIFHKANFMELVSEFLT